MASRAARFADFRPCELCGPIKWRAELGGAGIWNVLTWGRDGGMGWALTYGHTSTRHSHGLTSTIHSLSSELCCWLLEGPLYGSRA